MLLSDGLYVMAFCSTDLFWITRRAPFSVATLLDQDVEIDFQKETTPNDVVTVIATQPLTGMKPGKRLCERYGSYYVTTGTVSFNASCGWTSFVAQRFADHINDIDDREPPVACGSAQSSRNASAVSRNPRSMSACDHVESMIMERMMTTNTLGCPKTSAPVTNWKISSMPRSVIA